MSRISNRDADRSDLALSKADLSFSYETQITRIFFLPYGTQIARIFFLPTGRRSRGSLLFLRDADHAALFLPYETQITRISSFLT